MIIYAILKFVSEAGSDLFDGSNDFGSLRQHLFAIDVRDVVQIDVHGEPRQVEVEQIQRSATFQHELAAKEGMFVKLREEFAKTKEFLEVVGVEAGCFGGRKKIRGIDFHVCI
jgi:hypothetical protein